MPPQLEKIHVVPTAWQDEALARDGVSREVPCSALKGAFHFRALGKEMATHSSVLAWRIPGTGEPGGGVRGRHRACVCARVRVRGGALSSWGYTNTESLCCTYETNIIVYVNYVQLCVTLWTVACQAPLSMGFSRQEYWSGLTLPPLGSQAPGTSPTLPQPAPSRARRLEAGERRRLKGSPLFRPEGRDGP